MLYNQGAGDVAARRRLVVGGGGHGDAGGVGGLVLGGATQAQWPLVGTVGAGVGRLPGRRAVRLCLGRALGRGGSVCVLVCVYRLN